MKRGIWLCAILTAVLFSACKEPCEDFDCPVNQKAIEDILTGICICHCDNGFAGPDCSQTQHEFDIDLIKSYLLDNNIEAESTDSGLHYVITESAGGTTHPELSDEVEVTYKGYLIDGTVFDSGTLSFPLTGVIEGWQEGIPLFSKDDVGILFIPSALAYGENGQGGIPPNSVLIFDIELHDF